jgi:hypothetical protein
LIMFSVQISDTERKGWCCSFCCRRKKQRTKSHSFRDEDEIRFPKKMVTKTVISNSLEIIWNSCIYNENERMACNQMQPKISLRPKGEGRNFSRWDRSQKGSLFSWNEGNNQD